MAGFVCTVQVLRNECPSKFSDKKQYTKIRSYFLTMSTQFTKIDCCDSNVKLFCQATVLNTVAIQNLLHVNHKIFMATD